MSNVEHFDKFTASARKVIDLAQDEARQFQHDSIGTEHILIGLIREGESITARILESLNITLEMVRKAVEAIKGRGTNVAQGELSLTPHATTAIKMAMKEADARFPQTDVPMLGATYVQESAAVQMLQNAKVSPDLEALGVTLEKVRKALEKAKERGNSVLEIQTETGMAPYANRPEGDDDWHHPYFFIDTENLFLGLKRVPDCTAVKILQQLGVAIEELRARVFLEDVFTLQTTHQGYLQSFSTHVKKAWSLTLEEARRLHYTYISSNDLLLGLMREGSGVAATILKEMGIEPNALRKEFEQSYGHRNGDASDPITPTPHLKDVFELASNQARRLHHRSIGTGDILLVLIRESAGLEAGLLQNLGVDLYQLRTALRQAPDEDTGASASEAIPDAISEASITAPLLSISAIERDLQNREMDKAILAVYPFTPDALMVLEHARIEAIRLEQRVGPEHLLVGLAYLTFRQNEPVGKALKELGINFARTQTAVESKQGAKVEAVVLLHTALCRACLLLAVAEAEREHGEGAPIKSEHLLLGVLREDMGIIADLLGSMGTSVDAVRAKVLEFTKI